MKKNLFLSISKTLNALFPDHNLTIVGGAVRDRLLKRPIPDLDVTLPTDPAPLAKRFAQKTKGRSFVLDEERKVIRVSLTDGFTVDFSAYQGAHFNADMARRDFTVNAMAVPLKEWIKKDWNKKIIDPFQGKKDLKQKKIKTVSPKNLKEDPLRVLRGFRFAAQLGFTVAPSTLTHLKKAAKGLPKASPERQREELLKMFSAPAAKIVWDMEKAGVWDYVMPESKALRKTAPRYYGKGGVMKHTLNTVVEFENLQNSLSSWFPRYAKKIQAYLNEPSPNFPRFAHYKWACVLHDVGKPGTAEMKEGRLRFFDHDRIGAEMTVQMQDRYRWSSEETRRYAALVRNHMRPGALSHLDELSARAIHRFFRDLGDDAIGMILVSLADHLTYLTPKEKKKRASEHERSAIRMVNHYYKNPQKTLPPRILNGNDLMKEFSLKPSPFVGALLKEVGEAQAEGKVDTKEEGIAYLRKNLERLRREFETSS